MRTDLVRIISWLRFLSEIVLEILHLFNDFQGIVMLIHKVYYAYLKRMFCECNVSFGLR